MNRKVVYAALLLLLVADMVFAQRSGGDILLEETRKTAGAISLGLLILLGGGPIAATIAAIALSIVMGYKAYLTSRDQRDANPTLSGLKTFLLWAFGTISVLGGLVMGANWLLDGAVTQAIQQVLALAGGV